MRNHEIHENHEPMLRVNKETLCPVCGKHDWCLVRENGSAAICARIEDGSVKRIGDAGWLHVFDGTRNRQFPNTNFQLKKTNHPALKGTPPSKGGEQINFEKLTADYQRRCSGRQVRFLATSLGVTADSLKRLAIGWDGEAFCFPMADERSTIIGIRRRLGNGRKICVRGSQNGLFIPAGIEQATRLVICEGPTDCAAALDLGWDAIGRPNCESKIALTCRYVRRRTAVIVADRDSAGMRGARTLFEALDASGSAVRIIMPPAGCNDLREWKQGGGRISL